MDYKCRVYLRDLSANWTKKIRTKLVGVPLIDSFLRDIHNCHFDVRTLWCNHSHCRTSDISGSNAADVCFERAHILKIVFVRFWQDCVGRNTWFPKTSSSRWFLPFPSCRFSEFGVVWVENAAWQNQRMLQNHDEKRISTGYVALGRYWSSEGLDRMDTESTSSQYTDDERPSPVLSFRQSFTHGSFEGNILIRVRGMSTC